MPGTRTAPTVTDPAQKFVATLHFIDSSGDLGTDALVTTTAPTPAQLEAWAVAYQAATQASVYRVSLDTQWNGDPDPDNALTEQRNSVRQGINLLTKNLTTLATQTARVSAPVAAIMDGNNDIPLPLHATVAALLVAMGAIIPGFNLESAQYTERRERKNNPRKRV